MTRKKQLDEGILKLLREIEVHLSSGMDVPLAYRSADISQATYYAWRKKHGGICYSHLSEMEFLQKENVRMRGALQRWAS